MIGGIRSIPDTIPSEDRTLGWQVLAWTRAYLLQPDGPNAGGPWVFTPEQARTILRWFSIDERGRFVYRRGVLRKMKGSGKDPWAAALSAAELCGPVRFDGWDANGMPVAVQHPSPWIQAAAVSLDQNQNLMRLLGPMFSPAAYEEYAIDMGKTVVYARGVGQIEAVTSSPRALEGKRTSLTLMNESQEWVKTIEGMRWLKRFAGTSQSRTMGLPGRLSFATRTFRVRRALLRRRTRRGGKLTGMFRA